MEYKRIFSDSKTIGEPPKEKYVSIDVYAPPFYRPPYLFELRDVLNDKTEWSLYETLTDALAIRKAISILDNIKEEL